MSGQVTVNAVQLGSSATSAQNFVLQTNVDGTAKLARGNVGATSQDILSVGVDGSVSGMVGPAQFDTSTKFATMGAVQRALGNFRGFLSYNANTTLTSSQVGCIVDYWGSGSATFTLPLVSSVPYGAGFLICNTGGSNLTIQLSGSDVIYIPSSTAIYSVVITPGDNAFLYTANNGTSWIVAGAAALPYSSQFGSSLASNGYQKLPSGLIMQWGATANITVNTSLAITLPITFPNGFLSFVATSQNTGAAYATTVRNSNSQGTIYMFAGTGSCHWVAIGY